MLHDVCNASVVRLATLDPREKDSFRDIRKDTLRPVSTSFIEFHKH